ncbi:MBL fold metallo-hydrolase [Pseudomonas sp. FP603]|uniref:MBL fold metallo-hydrolase n=1 Tax=Pseudomonas TaxID=286 RepID=UPI00351EC9CD
METNRNRDHKRKGSRDYWRTHAHADHTRGDHAFRQAGAQVVGLRLDDVAQFFGIPQANQGTGAVDLGDRRIVVFTIPGHEPSHVAFHDPRTGYLFTGDTFYPDRLYVPRANFASYQAICAKYSFGVGPGFATFRASYTCGRYFPHTRLARKPK